MVPKYQLIIALCFIGGSLNKKVQKVGKIEPLYLLQEYQQSIFTALFENIWLEISPSFFVPLSECPFAIAKTHSSVLCDIMLSSMLTPSWLIFRIVSFKDLLNVRNPEKEWSAYGFESCVFIMVIRAERKTRTNGQTFKLDFPGNLCREAFTIIAMLCGWGAFILCINLP